MTGTSATTFNPKGVTTRAMVVATLYRLAGSPEVTEKAAFTDVVSGSYYEAAVAWAARNAIASGTSETTFEPNKAVTREQLAKFLFNYAAKHIKNANIEKQHTFKMEYFKDSRVNVEFGIMEDECSIILQRFFKDLRKK